MKKPEIKSLFAALILFTIINMRLNAQVPDSGHDMIKASTEQSIIVSCNCHKPGYGCGINIYCSMYCSNYCHHHHPISGNNEGVFEISGGDSNFPLISFSLPHKENVSLKIFDFNGRYVKTLAENELAEGEYQITASAGDISVGVYLLKLQSETASITEKLIVLK